MMLTAQKPKKCYSVFLTDETREKVDQLAKSAGVSFSKALGYVVETHVDNELSALEKPKIRR